MKNNDFFFGLIWDCEIIAVNNEVMLYYVTYNL